MEETGPPSPEETYLATYASTHPVYSRQGMNVSPGRRAQIRNFLLRHAKIDKTQHLLDVGCGDGALLRVARELGIKNAEGVDLSLEMVEKAITHGLPVKLQDVLSFLEERPPESFDVVCAFDLLEHLDQRKLLALCQNVLRTLKKGGRFLIHVPNGSSPYAGRVLYGDITHERAFTKESMQQILRTVGFVAVEAEEDEPVARGLVSSLRLCLWRLVRFPMMFRLAIETGTLRGYLLTLNIFVIAHKA
jgi:cyclopropane fatty-acyl-phospholipid synthase-like methyltransferase